MICEFSQCDNEIEYYERNTRRFCCTTCRVYAWFERTKGYFPGDGSRARLNDYVDAEDYDNLAEEEDEGVDHRYGGIWTKLGTYKTLLAVRKAIKRKCEFHELTIDIPLEFRRLFLIWGYYLEVYDKRGYHQFDIVVKSNGNFILYG